MQCAFEETSFSLESWTDSAFLIFSVVGIEVGLIVTFLNQVCKNSCDSVLFADFVSSTTTARLCRRCWSFQSEMWKCGAQADRCLFSKQLRLFREFGSSWLCVYYPWSFSFRWSDPNLKRDWLVFVGTSFAFRTQVHLTGLHRTLCSHHLAFGLCGDARYALLVDHW